MRTLNFNLSIGYNLIMADVRLADFSTDNGSGIEALLALATIAQNSFNTSLPGFTRIPGGSAPNTYAAARFQSLVDHREIDLNDIGSAAYIIVRYLGMRAALTA